MRQRLISAAVFIALGGVVLLFYQTIVLNCVVALLIFAALYEMLLVTGLVRDRVLFAVCAAFAVSLPLLRLNPLRRAMWVVCYLFIAALFVYLIFNYSRGRARLEQIGAAFFLSMLISCSFTCFVLLRDRYAAGTSGLGAFYIMFVLTGAWMSDAGGYFFGRAFGRRKLAPAVSPQKTVEGAVGGFVLSVAGLVALSFAFAGVSAAFGNPLAVHAGPLAAMGLLIPLVSVLGDLSASVLKREAHLKDFGNVIPGHGGVMDRFDSVMLTAPLVFLFVQAFPVLT